VFKTSTSITARFAAALGVSVFLAVPSSAHQLGWLLPNAQPRKIEAVGFSSTEAQADRSLADLVASVRSSVVSVTAQFTQAFRMGTPFGHSHEFDPSNSDKDPGRRLERLVSSKGTGFFISPDGYVVTNHVVESSRTVEVSTVDGMNYKAKVVASDPASDIALLKVDGRSDFPISHICRQGAPNR
jgi:serine protease Do